MVRHWGPGRLRAFLAEPSAPEGQKCTFLGQHIRINSD